MVLRGLISDSDGEKGAFGGMGKTPLGSEEKGRHHRRPRGEDQKILSGR